MTHVHDSTGFEVAAHFRHPTVIRERGRPLGTTHTSTLYWEFRRRRDAINFARKFYATHPTAEIEVRQWPQKVTPVEIPWKEDIHGDS